MERFALSVPNLTIDKRFMDEYCYRKLTIRSTYSGVLDPQHPGAQ